MYNLKITKNEKKIFYDLLSKNNIDKNELKKGGNIYFAKYGNDLNRIYLNDSIFYELFYLIHNYSCDIIMEFIEKTNSIIIQLVVLIISINLESYDMIDRIINTFDINLNIDICSSDFLSRIKLINIAVSINHNMFIYFLDKYRNYNLSPDVYYYAKDVETLEYIIDKNNYEFLEKTFDFLMMTIVSGNFFGSLKKEYSRKIRKLFEHGLDIKIIEIEDLSLLFEESFMDSNFFEKYNYNFDESIEEWFDCVFYNYRKKTLKYLLDLGFKPNKCPNNHIFTKLGFLDILLDGNINIEMETDTDGMKYVEKLIENGYDIKKILSYFIAEKLY